MQQFIPPVICPRLSSTELTVSVEYCTFVVAKIGYLLATESPGNLLFESFTVVVQGYQLFVHDNL